jgi:hypothetical protein
MLIGRWNEGDTNGIAAGATAAVAVVDGVAIGLVIDDDGATMTVAMVVGVVVAVVVGVCVGETMGAAEVVDPVAECAIAFI